MTTTNSSFLPLQFEKSASYKWIYRLFVASICAMLPVATLAKDSIDGPVKAHVVHVYDGDTFFAEAKIWPDQIVRVRVRIRGIDAPEIKAKCDQERASALVARERLERLIAGKPVQLRNVSGGKYYGRVLADVETDDGENIANSLLVTGSVRVYSGAKRKSWCG